MSKLNREKLEQAIKKIGGKRELARRVDEKPSTVNNWFSRDTIPLDKVPAVIKALNHEITPHDINSGFFGSIMDAQADYKTEPAPRLLPLLEYADLDEIENQFNAPKIIPIDNNLSAKLSDHAIALIVENDSMARKISKGDTIILDPLIVPEPGDIVLAKAQNPTRWVLGKYKIIGYNKEELAEIEITPENSFYPNTKIIEQQTGSVIAPIIEHRRILKPL